MSKFLDVLDKLNEAEVNWIKGSELSPELQKEVKARYVHRYTGNNKPQWAKETWKDGKPYPLHFKDDKDWLENTKFAVTKKGKLCNKTKYCQSSPSFPNDSELRKNIKECVMEESNPLLEKYTGSLDYTELGNKIIEMLHLKVKGGRVETSWGSKTPEGLAKSLERVFEE